MCRSISRRTENLCIMSVRLALHDLRVTGATPPWVKMQVFCHDLVTHWDAL